MNCPKKEFEAFAIETESRFKEKVCGECEKNPFSDYMQDYPGFPLYMSQNDPYYKQTHFERLLEFNIREYLINPLMYEVFDLTGASVQYPKGIVVKSTNATKERHYTFEFIFTKNERRTGIKYVDDDYAYIRECMKDEHIDETIIINWDDTESEHYLRHINSSIKQTDPAIREMPVKEFFDEFLSEELFVIFNDTVSRAIVFAESLLGYKTIQPLSKNYLSEFREYVEKNLLEFEYDTKRYHVFEPRYENGKKKPYAFIDQYSFKEEYETLYDNFIKKGMYKALIGKSDFANSFITAEYLYKVLKNGNQLDYTAVVCGYIKAVEQLLHTIMKIAMSYRSDEGLEIDQRKPKTNDEKKIVESIPGRRQKTNREGKLINRFAIPLKEENENYFDITMGSLIIFLNSSDNNWLIPELDYKHRNSLLNAYRDECRNEHFHKDNIRDEKYESVEHIRDNTFMILFLLLGGCRFTESRMDDVKRLGIIDEAYSKLYSKLLEIPRSVCDYKIVRQDGSEIKCVRLYNQPCPEHDKYGTFDESIVFFSIVESFKYDYKELIDNLNPDNQFILRRGSMPNQMSCVLRNGEERLIIKKI